MVTGRLPFEAENETAVLFQHVRDNPPLSSLFVSDLDKNIEFIILKCLAKEPEKRYETITALPDNVKGDLADLLPAEEMMSPPHNLPASLTAFIQRTEEIDLIQTKLMQPSVRLLTLLGIGGVGKTRLSLEVGKNLLRKFKDGVFFIDLTTVSMPAFLPSTIAHAIGLVEEGDMPVETQLLDYLCERHLLLILDNWEQILEAVPSPMLGYVDISA